MTDRMEWREYEARRDREPVRRMYRECGWLDKGKEGALDAALRGGRALVAEVDGEAECMVHTVSGTMRYLEAEVPAGYVVSVTTSRIARKRGLASRLAAEAVARDVADGAFLSCLGVFEQGYYDRLGFGTGGYELVYAFDPAELVVDASPRVPRRVSPADWRAAHAARLGRRRGHGSANLTDPETTHSEMLWAKEGFGLGYTDAPRGGLSHYLWCDAKEAEHGPYAVSSLVFRTREELLELVALLRTIGDQVRLVRMVEPPGIQLQDLFPRPFRSRQRSERGRFETKVTAGAFWQARICDLAGCLTATCLEGDPVRFNLILTDPIESLLPAKAPWRGVAGTYVVTLGPVSSAEAGRRRGLPTLSADVGAFTRAWLGVRPASGLAMTDELSGPERLLADLDRVLRLPQPKPDWDF